MADIAAPPPAPPPSSRFTSHSKYDFAGVLGVVERSAPATLGSMDSVHGSPTTAGVTSRSWRPAARFTAFADGDVLHLLSTVDYTVRGYYKPLIGPTLSAGCGGGAAEAAADHRAGDADHGLAGLAARFARRYRAHGSGVGRAARPLRREHSAPRRYGARRGVGSRGPDPAPRRHRPANRRRRLVRVPPRNGGSCSRSQLVSRTRGLELGPERLRIGHVQGHGSMLTVPASLDAHPLIVTSAHQPSTNVGALPPRSHDSIGNGFHIVLDGVDRRRPAVEGGDARARGSTGHDGRTNHSSRIGDRATRRGRKARARRLVRRRRERYAASHRHTELRRGETRGDDARRRLRPHDGQPVADGVRVAAVGRAPRHATPHTRSGRSHPPSTAGETCSARDSTGRSAASLKLSATIDSVAGEGPVCHPRRSRGARRSDGARRRGGEAALSRSATPHSVSK